MRNFNERRGGRGGRGSRRGGRGGFRDNGFRDRNGGGVTNIFISKGSKKAF